VSSENPLHALTAEFEAAKRNGKSATNPGDWMMSADHAAQQLQQKVQRQRRRALLVTSTGIAGLATLALTTQMSAPLIFSPVIVFLMIRYLDVLRKRPDVFHFVCLRLTAETIRLLGAVRNHQALFQWTLTTRKEAAHSVIALSGLAAQAFEQVATTSAPGAVDTWAAWVEEQKAYFGQAEQRERERAARGRWVFNAAFIGVGLIGVVAMIIMYPAARTGSGSSLGLLLTATASTIGSCGLAYISYVRDMRTFDHSFDYLHMKSVFEAYPHETHNPLASNLRLLKEAANEQERWALRMAGHFNRAPN